MAMLNNQMVALLLAPGRECDGELNSTDPAWGQKWRADEGRDCADPP